MRVILRDRSPNSLPFGMPSTTNISGSGHGRAIKPNSAFFSREQHFLEDAGWVPVEFEKSCKVGLTEL